MAALALHACPLTGNRQASRSFQANALRKQPVVLPRKAMVPRAFMGATELAQIAEAAPGSVDAPVWAIVGGAVVVTVVALLASLGLKGGTDAAIEMQNRDKKKWNKKQ